MIANSAKKLSPAFACRKEVEPAIPSPRVPRACDNPAAGAGCCQWSEAPCACLVSGSPPGQGRGGERETLLLPPCDSPQAQSPSAAPRAVPPKRHCLASLCHPNPLNSEAAEIMPDCQCLHQSHPDLLPPIAACITGTPGWATLPSTCGKRESTGASPPPPPAWKDPDVLNCGEI